LISCMGLFALVSYAVEGRTKEIGIRKVLGASVGSIVGLVTKEFLALVMLAGLLGLPAAWYFMNVWLQDFAYHVPLGPGVFIGALLITLLLALATIGFRSMRAAHENPVKSLRTE